MPDNRQTQLARLVDHRLDHAPIDAGLDLQEVHTALVQRPRGGTPRLRITHRQPVLVTTVGTLEKGPTPDKSRPEPLPGFDLSLPSLDLVGIATQLANAGHAGRDQELQGILTPVREMGMGIPEPRNQELAGTVNGAIDGGLYRARHRRPGIFHRRDAPIDNPHGHVGSRSIGDAIDQGHVDDGQGCPLLRHRGRRGHGDEECQRDLVRGSHRGTSPASEIRSNTRRCPW